MEIHLFNLGFWKERAYKNSFMIEILVINDKRSLLTIERIYERWTIELFFIKIK